MKKTIFPIFALLLFTLSTQAQISKILHQTFEIEEIANLELNLVGEYEIEKWAGSTVLTETKVELYDASPGIFNHFVETGRYEIEAQLDGGLGKLVSMDTDRKAIYARKKGEKEKVECFEIVKVRIFVPDDFEIVDQTKLVREVETEEVSSN